MNETIRLGGQVSDATLEEIRANSAEQIKTVQQIQENLRGWADVFDLFGWTDKAEEYRDAADAYDDVIAQAKQAADDADKTGENQMLQLHENNIARLKDDVRDYEKVLSDSTHKVVEQDYRNLIENARDQYAEYDEERTIHLNKINEMRADQQYWVEDENGNMVFNENNTIYQEHLTAIENIDATMDDLVEKQRQWNKELKELGVIDANNLISEYNDNLRKLQNTTSLNEAKGIRKTEADYTAENTEYANIQTEAERMASELQAKLDKDVKWKRIEKDSAEYKAQKDLIASYEDQANQAAINAAKNEHESELLPIQEHQDELDKLKIEYAKFKEEIDDIIAQGGEVSDTKYDELKTNISNQKTELGAIKDVYDGLASTHAGDEFGLQMQKAASEIAAQIDALDDEVIDIDLKIDNKELNHLKQDFTELEQQIETLKTDLEKALSESAKGSILGDLIETTGQEIINLSGQANEYREQMQKIQDSYAKTADPNGYLRNEKYVELATNLYNTTTQMEQLTKATIEYRKQLEQLPMERVNRRLDTAEANRGLADSEIGLKEERGEIITKEDYAGTLASYEATVAARQEALEIAQNALESAEKNYEESGTEEAYAELLKERTAVTEAQTNLNKAEADLLKSQKEASNAALNAARTRIREIDVRIAELESQASVNRAAGVRRTTTEIVGEASRRGANANAELRKFDEENGPIDDLNVEQREARQKITADIAKSEAEAMGYLKEYLEFESIEMNRNLKNLQRGTADVDDEMEAMKRHGQEIPDELFDVKVGGLEETKTQLQGLVDFYQNLIDVNGDEHPEWVDGWQD